MKTKFLAAGAAIAAAVLVAAACSPGDSGDSQPDTTAATTAASATDAAAAAAESSVAPDTPAAEGVSVVVLFQAGNGTGTVTITGENSAVADWFASQPGEVTFELVDADVGEPVSVVQELISVWFFSDDASGEVPPSVFVSAGGDIADSLGTSYVVEARGLPAAPGTETTSDPTDSASTASAAPASTTPTTGPASTTSTTTTTSSVPAETSEPSASTTTTSSTTTSTTAPPPATTAPVVADLSPAELRVQVLNGSGIAGAAGRLSARLRDAGYDVLPAGNAPGRFGSSAVYYVAAAHQDEAEVVAEVVSESATGNDDDGGVVVVGLPSSGEIPSGTANVVVLIGRDSLGTGLRTAERTSGLRRTPRTDVALPLPDDVPRDRYVPGLTDIQIFSQVNDEGSDEVKGALNALSAWFNIAGRYVGMAERRGGQLAADLEDYMDYDYLQDEVWPNIERTLEYFGFTPQNTCGAPAGYSFIDLIKPTREFDPETQNYTGDAIFTTDRLIELHGGQRINPSENLDFYIRQAVQTAHDQLRASELLSETETMQLILCKAWVSPEGEMSEFANSMWYAQFIPGVQPRESLLSQGTYHFKEISRNGNLAYVLVCHPTLGSRYIDLAWREAGYRAEVVGSLLNIGCQTNFERRGFVGDHEPEETIRFSFGERAVSASDILEFPRNK